MFLIAKTITTGNGLVRAIGINNQAPSYARSIVIIQKVYGRFTVNYVYAVK